MSSRGGRQRSAWRNCAERAKIHGTLTWDLLWDGLEYLCTAWVLWLDFHRSPPFRSITSIVPFPPATYSGSTSLTIYCALHISVWFVSGDFFFFAEFLETTFSHWNRTTIWGKAPLGILTDIMSSSLHIQALLDLIWLSFCEETQKRVHLTAFTCRDFQLSRAQTLERPLIVVTSHSQRSLSLLLSCLKVLVLN